ncbi:quercetin 2,3-dioxygenase [Hirsutella rhossiliensis]|uniref:Quercetin 2,3-dioxygenase n=1 Tax=Hirsutella rhossiliensis TaxID=111463 RepID=A0A9P8SG28_9HYPO|nr:quercetin 2,3-dioxygenase [Hirsutella rhossiliensis]KAH0961381.1 quercetin 2,3-dioxygenase [Hirsutella rhossiliensis]
MKWSRSFLGWALLSPTASAHARRCESNNNSLVVDEAPDSVRPYVLPKYKGRAIFITASQVLRFSITANSSDGAFALVQHSGKVSGWTPARPHTHRRTHEHFYCAKGRSELWGQRNATGASHEARVGTLGDYGSMPPGAIHTFQLVDPDAQLTHVFHPGGFEHLFDEFSSGGYDSKAVMSPYPPDPEDKEPFGAMTPELDEKLQRLDLYQAPAELFIPRRDFVNGTAGAGLSWHNGSNALPDDPTEPYFVAKDYGPKFLNTNSGYKILQPLATATQTSETGNFTMGTLIMSPKLDNETVETTQLPHHFAIQMEEGQLALSIPGYPETYLIQGDVAFIPADTSFTYYATVPFTKFLYMNAGASGLDHQLLQDSISWDFPVYPAYAGFQSRSSSTPSR